MIDNYNDMTLSRFMRIDRILHTPAEDIDKQVQIVAALTDLTEDEVLHLPLADYASLAARAAFLGTQCQPAPYKGEALADLLPVTDFTRITTAQYVDFQTFAAKFPSTLPELLSCLLVPKGHTYNDGYDMGQVRERVGALPLPLALGVSAFFFGSFLTSIEATVTSLERTARKMGRTARARQEALLEQIRETLSLLHGAGSPPSIV